MSNMISELRDAGRVLTDEQQVQVVIRFLPHNWEHMKMHLTHNENIKTLDVVAHHMELEKKRLLAKKPSTNVYMIGLNSQCGKGHKCKQPNKSEVREILKPRNRNLTNMGKESVLPRRKPLQS